MSKKINLTLKVWRQKNCSTPGKFETYKTQGVDTDMSFLEMLDVVNEKLTKEGKNPLLLTTIAARAFVVRVEL